METANYLHITIDQFKLQSIYEMEIIQKINEHVVLNLTALLDENQQESDIYTTMQDDRIKIYNNLEQKYIFIGMITSIHIENEYDVFYLKIRAVSPTFMMDVKKYRKSFQNKKMTYKNVVNFILNKYNQSYGTEVAELQNQIGDLMIQYNETDWEFLKRLASHFNKGLISSCVHSNPEFFFGEPKGAYRGELGNQDFSVTKDIDEFMEADKNEGFSVFEMDYITYRLEGGLAYNIGDYLDFRNKRLYVKAVTSKFVKGELLYTYYLCSKSGLKRNMLNNKEIQGLSIKGQVVAIERDFVKVHLDIDVDSEPEEDLWLFQYSTVYAAEGNAGWYCMPEKGDTVFIYFPNKNERDAVSVNSIRENSNINTLSNPDVKYFRTASGKELKFSPDEILITAMDDKHGSIFIRLSEEKGIEISSSKPIHITSSSDINFDAEKKLKIHADDEIVLKCKSSKITMDSLIDIISKDVKIN